MQIVILAAGQGKRMKALTDKTHKSLLPINSEETFLSRLLHQLNEYEINKLVIITGYKSKSIEGVVSQFQLNSKIVFNKLYKEDTNIYSMKLALDYINSNETTIIIEADIYLDDIALKQIYFESKKNKSIWFTRGIFKHNQYGGILEVDNKNEVKVIDIIPKYLDKYSQFYKLLGILTIGKNELEFFKKYVNIFVKKSIKQYYLQAWIDNLSELPCLGYDINPSIVSSLNTSKEYKDFLENLRLNNKYLDNYKLSDVNVFSPIEGCISKRVDLLFKKISNERVWTKPIIADSENHLVMDGHHRLEVAKKMDLKKIPVIYIDYNNVPIWSLKEEEIVTKSLVISRALSGNIYPNKTVKHSFNFKVANCNIELNQLK